MEHPAVAGRPESHAEEWRRENHITVQGSGIPKPCLTFEVRKEEHKGKKNLSYL